MDVLGSWKNNGVVELKSGLLFFGGSWSAGVMWVREEDYGYKRGKVYAMFDRSG